MASTGKCRFCGGAVRSDERNCPQCGGANENYVADTPRTVFLPKTIDELKEYCSERGMPLLRMRFFIDENYQQPRAFGIYRDGNDFVVYKNKSDGSRSVRYRGPDEAHAVNELFLKLLEECHNRGIYPDGKPATRSASTGSTATRSTYGTRKSSKSPKILLYILLGLFLLGLIIGIANRDRHKRGYYRLPNKTGIYYHIGSDWYYSSGYTWYEVSTPAASDTVDDYYLGNTFNSGWGVSNFSNSDAYRDYQDRNSSSSDDYDDWDWGDTDWDSDW